MCVRDCLPGRFIPWKSVEFRGQRATDNECMGAKRGSKDFTTHALSMFSEVREEYCVLGVSVLSHQNKGFSERLFFAFFNLKEGGMNKKISGWVNSSYIS